MTSADAQPRRARPSLPVRLLHLAAVSAVVLAAPLLLPVGEHPAFFAAFGAGGRDAWALALLVLVAPPVAAWVPGVVAHLVNRQAGWIVHLLALAVFGALGGLVLAAALDAGAALAWLLALATAAAVPAAYAAVRPLRLGLTVLAPLPLLVLALFVLDTPAGALARGDGNPAAADVTPKKDIPVVMVEFDEFPLYSLQTPSGALDATRFPQFARLARESTWYPRYTPVFDETTRLSSSILTGRRWLAHGKPWYGDYPKNLYKLLGRHYRLLRSEEATDFCSPRLCARRLRPEGLRLRVRHLLHGTTQAYLRRLAPPSVEQGMAPEDPALRPLVPRRRNRRRQVLDNLIGNGRIERWDEWVSSIDNRRGGALYFKHSLMPHTPWRYLPDGRTYRRDPRTEPIPGFGGDQGASDPWLMRTEQQRHLLQTRLADRMLGFLLDRLHRRGVWDKALVIITADHGQAFGVPGANRHVADARTWPQLATAPLFIHYPGQDHGRVSPKRVRTYDFVPTIADVVGAKIPWRVRGTSILHQDGKVPQHTLAVETRPGGKIVAPMSRWAASLRRDRRRQARLFGTGSRSLYDIGPRRDLLGRRVSSLHVRRQGRLRTPLFDKTFYPDVDLRSVFVPANVAGRIDGGSLPRGRTVVVALNGRIAATGKTARLPRDPHAYYTVIVDPARFRQGHNDVQIYLLQGGALLPLGGT
jgi:hypothetical protein